MKEIKILGIETSCDETSAAVVINGRQVISNVVSTQIEIHKKYGGVVPEIASRKHVELIIPVIKEALEEAKLSLEEIDAFSVTCGPGLVGALLVGVSAAKALSYVYNKPLIPVNHIEGHISANYIEYKELEPPFICLVASGGHSHIINVMDYNSLDIIGQTRDDAAGEAYDKIARTLGLGYPGGPIVDTYAKSGNMNAIHFPRSKFNDNKYDFSFSGVKTSVINYINRCKQKGDELNTNDICASFQKAVVDVLVDNVICACKDYNISKVALAGGVAANSFLREQLKEKAQDNRIEFYYPRLNLCTDNAAMIASAGYYGYLKKRFANTELNAIPNLKIGQKII